MPALRRLWLGATLALSIGGPALAKPPVWIVRDRDSEMLIFGSIHALPPGLDWRPAALDRALRRADDVWFEFADPAGDGEGGRRAQAAGALPPDRSLFQLLPADLSGQLQRAAAELGLDKTVLDRLQPWMADVVVAGAAARRAGLATETGVEAELAAAARPGAARRSLDSVDEQVALYAGAPLPEQIAALRRTLTDLDRPQADDRRLVEAWMNGDLKPLAAATEGLRRSDPDAWRRTVAERNARWTRRLAARLKGRGRSVVVVGVGHLVGPGSLPARLRALGYSVEGP